MKGRQKLDGVDEQATTQGFLDDLKDYVWRRKVI